MVSDGGTLVRGWGQVISQVTFHHPGPLFSFDVHEDVRMVNDASLEKDEVCLGLGRRCI